MSNLPWLTVLGLLPLVGAVVLFALPASASRQARPIALGFSLATLLAALGTWAAYAGADYGRSGQFKLEETHSWIPSLGVSYGLGVDGMALALIVMAAVLTPICLLAAWNDLEGDADAIREAIRLAWARQRRT